MTDVSTDSASKRRRWNQPEQADDKKVKTSEWEGSEKPAAPSARWDTPAPANTASTPVRKSRWDATPDARATEDAADIKKGRWDETPTSDRGNESSRTWDETPQKAAEGATPSKRSRSRWDETPQNIISSIMATPGATPAGNFGDMTPTPSQLRALTPEHLSAIRWELEIDERNKPLSDEELDAILPEGYKVLEAPQDYVPIRTPARKLMATPTPLTTGFAIQDETIKQSINVGATPANLPTIKPEDMPYFEKLLKEENEDEMTPEEAKERKILKLLLKVKIL